MSLDKDLLKIIESEGVEIKDKDDVLSSLRDAIYDNRIMFLHDEDNKAIGFFTWENDTENGKTNIYVNNMLVLNASRGKYNLLELRKFFKDKYGKINKYFWHSSRKEKIMDFVQNN